MTAARPARTAGPLFLVGAPRSGTTLLYKALCLHPGVAYLSNWTRPFPGAPQVAALNRLAPLFHERRRRVWFGDDGANAYVFGEKRSLATRVFPMPIEGEPFFRRLGLPEVGNGHIDPAAGTRTAAALSAVRKWAGGSLVVSKRITNNRYLAVLADAMPGARFVNLVRDGRAVAYSLSRVNWWNDSYVWWYGDTPTRWAAEGRDPWELCARHWVEELGVIDEGLSPVGAERVLEISYESFVSSPLSTLGDIARFTGLDADRRWTAELERLRFPDRNEGWRAALPADVVARVEGWQRPALEKHGYR